VAGRFGGGSLTSSEGPSIKTTKRGGNGTRKVSAPRISRQRKQKVRNGRQSTLRLGRKLSGKVQLNVIETMGEGEG